MKIILNVVFLLTISYSISAQQIPDLILTKEQNEKWIDELEQMDLDNQLALIRKRILLDTNVFIKRSYPHGIRPANESEIGNRTTGYHKPLWIFGGGASLSLKFGNKTENKAACQLSVFLNEQEVIEIQILRHARAGALYGTRGSEGGVIIFTFESKESLDRIEKIIALCSRGD
jgi:hypothetical protein